MLWCVVVWDGVVGVMWCGGGGVLWCGVGWCGGCGTVDVVWWMWCGGGDAEKKRLIINLWMERYKMEMRMRDVWRRGKDVNFPTTTTIRKTTIKITTTMKTTTIRKQQ